MPPPQRLASSNGRRIIICDYNQLLQSVTGLLRMNGYVVFQAYDADAARELCAQLVDIELLVLNTFGTGIDTGELIQSVRAQHPGLPVLHIGNTVPASVPPDVPTLAEDFTSATLLLSVEALVGAGSTNAG